MKRTIFILLILATSIFSQKHPVAGESYKIKYNPAESGILNPDGEILVVYVFNYWGTKPSRNNIPEEMFQNVLDPDSGRTLIFDKKGQKKQTKYADLKRYTSSISDMFN